jgi:tRNA/rRNA methyltransferase
MTGGGKRGGAGEMVARNSIYFPGKKPRAASKKTVPQKTAVSSLNQRFRIVLVEPEYELNVGAVARAMKNFGFSDLCIVNPKCNPTGFDAIKYSKHAREILEGAKISRSLGAATKGCKFSVGTTGVLYRHWGETFRTPISLRDLRRKLAGQKEGKIALVFGNEGVGLSEKHISSCDLIVTIPTNKEYPALNLSHAVAIALYELSGLPVLGFTPSGREEKEQLVKAFSLLVARYSKIMRNPKKARVAFRRMVGKAMLTDKECASILGVLRRAVRELGEKG